MNINVNVVESMSVGNLGGCIVFDSILQSRASCEPDPSYADGRVPKALAKACTSFLHDYAVSSYTIVK